MLRCCNRCGCVVFSGELHRAIRSTVAGLLHALLNVPDASSLMGHPSVGASWEGFIVEQICAQLPQGADVGFYRTAAGAELDLVVDLGSKKIGFEIKFSSAPKLSRGFWQACDDIGLAHAYVVAAVPTGWPLKSAVRASVDVIAPHQLAWALAR